MLRRIARFHPFLILLGLTILVWGVWAVSGTDYDDNGIGGVLFLLSYGLGAPFLTLRRLLEPLAQLIAPEVLTVASAVITAGLYVLADRLLMRFANRRPQHVGAGA